MTIFDFFVLAIVGVAAIGGFMRGFVQEVLSLSAWIVAILAIYYLHTDMTALIFSFTEGPIISSVIAFSLLLIVPYVAMRMIARRAGQSSRDSLLGPIDRVLGFGFGMLKGVIVVVMAFSLIVLGYDSVWGSTGRPAWMSTARTYPFINASADQLVQLIRERQSRLNGEEAELAE